MASQFTTKPHQVTRRLIVVLPERARDILVHRYGLDSKEQKTLESIGKMYDITRERVRQIENHAIQTIRKSEAYEEESEFFDTLETLVDELGGVVTEDHLLDEVSEGDTSLRNHLAFLLEVGSNFKKKKEDKDLRHRWYIHEAHHASIESAIKNLYKNLSNEELVSENEMVTRFIDHLRDVAERYRKEEIARRYLTLSKRIDKNPLGEWGRAESPHVRVKGMRDYAYLVLRKHGSPMHFREVAEKIEEYFGKTAHIATTHNELIKDPRFVLVGRGLYALREWGYVTGVVKDVVRKILEKNGPLPKDEIIELVMKERYVKPNTILVNLQDTSVFGKNKDGTYFVKPEAEIKKPRSGRRGSK